MWKDKAAKIIDTQYVLIAQGEEKLMADDCLDPFVKKSPCGPPVKGV